MAIAEILPEMSLPPAEAIAFFRQKTRIPTERWTDLWRAEHDRGFMVAGAARDDLLEDLQTAIDGALSEGTTLAEFRNQWDEIIGRYGWSYTGARNWRSRLVFETNLRSSYAAGRWAQMSDPEVRAARPYLEYRHGDSAQPRPLHLEWDGTILPADDPWWDTHYPPNGWGCSCAAFAVSDADLERENLAVGEAPDDGTYEWTDRATGELHEIPAGIDPGWDYHPGKSWVNPATESIEPL